MLKPNENTLESHIIVTCVARGHTIANDFTNIHETKREKMKVLALVMPFMANTEVSMDKLKLLIDSLPWEMVKKSVVEVVKELKWNNLIQMTSMIIWAAPER